EGNPRQILADLVDLLHVPFVQLDVLLELPAREARQRADKIVVALGLDHVEDPPLGCAQDEAATAVPSRTDAPLRLAPKSYEPRLFATGGLGSDCFTWKKPFHGSAVSRTRCGSVWTSNASALVTPLSSFQLTGVETGAFGRALVEYEAIAVAPRALRSQ